MDTPFLIAVTDYMARSVQLRDTMTSKIASLNEEVKQLRQRQVSSDALKDVVSKLASAGLVDEPNRAFFTRSTNDSNVGVQLQRLSALLKTDVAEKQASAPSIFKVKGSGAEPVQDEASRNLHSRLSKLQKRGV